MFYSVKFGTCFWKLLFLIQKVRKYSPVLWKFYATKIIRLSFDLPLSTGIGKIGI